MNDLIDRQAAICIASGYCHPADIANALAKLPSAQQWIPCSERLPDVKGEYLVMFHPCYWDNVQPGVKVGIDSFRGKTTWAKKKHQRVIAWMPLPEPYKGEQNG